MRIVVATDVTVPGGVDTYVLALIDALLINGHETVLFVEQNTTSPVGVMAEQVGVEVVRLPLYRRWHPRSAIEDACRRRLATIRPEGLHVVTGSPKSCLALRGLGIEHGIPLLITESQVGQDIELTSEERAEIRASYAAAIAVVFVSSGNRDTMAAIVSLAGVRSKVIANGVDLQQLAPLRKTVLRPRTPARLVSAARLSPEKSLRTLISAVDLLPPSIVGEVNIYGDGPERVGLSEQISLLGLGDRVHLRGWTQNILPLLRAHDLFILPSTAEGMPYALLEAMAVGLATVCTDVPGNVEALAEGAAGRLVPQRDVNALADGIRDCLENPVLTEARARMAISLIQSRHDRRAGMNQTVELWQNIPQHRTSDLRGVTS